MPIPGKRAGHNEPSFMSMPSPFASFSLLGLRLAGACAISLTLIALPPAQAQIANTNDLTKLNDANPQSSSAANAAANAAANVPDASPTSTGVTQLRQLINPVNNRLGSQPEQVGRQILYVPGEFERYVQERQDGQLVRRFGSNLLTDPALTSSTQDPLPVVPADYIVRPGDEIALDLWGSIDANLRLTVDRAGRIAVPRVGAINVGGLRNADLADAITRRVAQVFKNFELTASLGQVRPIRVFVGGYAQQPGSVLVSGLSSLLHALMRAGGPSAGGSFRDIHLSRGGKEVAQFDLYDLLLKGDRSTDQLVQPDDVIFVGPVGAQVALLGSVNVPAIYELKAGESLSDLLRMAGGFSAVADRSRVSIERLSDRSTGHVSDLMLPRDTAAALATGDVVHAYSAVTVTQSNVHRNQSVRVEGEVARPGVYILAPGSVMADALKAAGGLTSAAYPYATEFTRESVRRAQESNYERALRDLETDMAKNQANHRATTADEIAAVNNGADANARLLDRLRQARPTGRIVLQLAPESTSLPNLPLEDGDAIHIPPRNSSVGVFGSVFSTGSFIFERGHTAEQYLALAGGPTRGADKESMFMIRANGSVVSARQGASFWHSNNQFRDTVVEPGDTLFVPEELMRTTFVQDAKDWTQILYQFGLGLAGLNALGL
jgi:protein involved in polysaccharide export with SLBB domain